MKRGFSALGSALLTLAGATAATSLLPATAQAQFSDSYQFLKAVRERDGMKVKGFIDQPGSTLVDTRDQSSGDAALHIVVKGRDIAWINFLAAGGAKIDIRDRDGNTPLILASQLGFSDGVKVLLARGANPNARNDRGETPLIYAVQSRDPLTARALLEAGGDSNLADRITGLSARDYAERDRRSGAILKMMDEIKPAAAAPQTGPK